MTSVEAQAEFIENLYSRGRFVFADTALPPDDTDGAFFQQRDDCQNEFTWGFDATGAVTTDPALGAQDFTVIANHAWEVLRTG